MAQQLTATHILPVQPYRRATAPLRHGVALKEALAIFVINAASLVNPMALAHLGCG